VLGQQAQVVDQQLLIAQGIGLDVAAHQHQVGAQLLHQVELALGAVEVFCRRSRRQPSKSRNGWNRVMAMPRSAHIWRTSRGLPA
jgi:hypothetical protein